MILRNSTSGEIIENTALKRLFIHYIHRAIIHNIQYIEAFYVFTSRWMEKFDIYVKYIWLYTIYNEIYVEQICMFILHIIMYSCILICL